MNEKDVKLVLINTVLLALLVIDLFFFGYLYLLRYVLREYLSIGVLTEISNPLNLAKLIITDIPSIFGLGVAILSSVSLYKIIKNDKGGVLVGVSLVIASFLTAYFLLS